jgi:hypothetical protein
LAINVLPHSLRKRHSLGTQMNRKLLELKKKTISTVPWYAQSAAQGFLIGLLLAQGGLSAQWLLKLLPFLDFAAISRTKYLLSAFKAKEQALKTSPSKRPEYDKQISWLSSFRPIASVIINGTLAASIAPIVAPYSPFANPTKQYYHRVVSIPATYSSLNSLEKSTRYLLSQDQRYWLNEAEVANLTKKKTILQSIKIQLDHDNTLKSNAQYVASTRIDNDTYQRVLDYSKSLQSDSRYDLALTKSLKAAVKAAQPKAQAFANEVERKRKVEEARQAALVAAEKVRWGLYYQNSELKDSAISACKNAAFEKTGQEKHWLFDDRGLDFNIAPVGGKIWVGGPFKVEIARGNLDGSKRAVTVGVDCYFDKNSPDANGTIQVDW